MAMEGDALMLPSNGLLKNGRRDLMLSVTWSPLRAAVVEILEVEVLMFYMNLLKNSIFASRHLKVYELTTRFL